MQKKKTLYVTDLDGTLLKSDKTLSSFTARTINRLVKEGMLITYATARSLISAQEVIKGLDVTLPVIVYNGAFILSANGKNRLSACLFTDREKEEILTVMQSGNVYPRVYALQEGRERYSYLPEKLSDGTKAYLLSRKGDIRANPTVLSELCLGEVYCFSCIDDYHKLFLVYEKLKEKYEALLYRDPYTGDFWLEVLPRNATKAMAVCKLKDILGCDEVVSFGDETNDLSMFASSDRAYAVAGANDALKKAATACIGFCDEDGVAKFLLEEWENRFKNE